MRDLVLMFTIAGICASAFVTPAIGLLGYIWFGLMRPDVLAFSKRQYSLVLALVTLAVSFRHVVGFPNLIKNPISVMLLLQQIPIALSVVFAVQMSLSIPMYERYMRMIVIVLLIPVMIETEKWLKILYFVMVFSMGFTALKFGASSAIHGGGGLVKGLAGMYGDSNGLALAMAILIPLAVSARTLTSSKIVKLACLGIAAAAVITIVMTGSRGNMVAFAGSSLLLVWRSKYKVAGLILLVLLALPAVYLAGNRLSQRLDTIVEYEDDASASGRLDFWKAAIKMSKDYPLFGVGYGEKNYIALAGRYLGRENSWVVHNTYLQSLVDTGAVGFLLYAGTLWGTILWLGHSVRRMKRLKPEWAGYPAGLQASLAAFAIGSTFYSRQDFEFAYFVLMTAAAWYAIEKRALAETSRSVEPLATPGLAAGVPGRVGLRPAQPPIAVFSGQARGLPYKQQG